MTNFKLQKNKRYVRTPISLGRAGGHVRTPISLGRAGFSTIELLIAFAIIILALTGVIGLVFGNQSMTLDAELNNLALYKAEEKMELAFASAKEGFDKIVNTNDTDGIFGLETRVLSTPCYKTVYSNATWTAETLLQDIGLVSVFASPEELDARAGDCLVGASEGWDNPGSLGEENINGQSDATGIDVIDEYLYLTTNPTGNNKEDFFIYQFDPTVPGLLTPEVGKLDLEPNDGAFDVDVAGDYAYVAAASSTAQLQVVDVTPPPSTPNRVAKLQLANVDPGGSWPEGRTIVYREYSGTPRVYVGTRETLGREFHVIDVSNPLIPDELGAGLELNHTIRDIDIQGDYAYLATSADECEVIVIDISDPTGGSMVNPCPPGGGSVNVFNAPGDHDGAAIQVLGDRIYLGRAGSSASTNEDDFFILDRALVHDGADDTDGAIDSYDVPSMSSGSYTTGIIILGHLAFLGLDSPTIGLEILNIFDENNIQPHSSCSSFNFSENSTAIDMESYQVVIGGNTIDKEYIFSANGSNAEIRVIYDQDPVCSP